MVRAALGRAARVRLSTTVMLSCRAVSPHCSVVLVSGTRSSVTGSGSRCSSQAVLSSTSCSTLQCQ